jgi:methyl-accepting chemotaxis protein
MITVAILILSVIIVIFILHFFITRPVGKMVMLIDHESKEIANANRKLAERTQQQSSSLVETSASLEQMSSIVYNNADDAKKASELVRSARETVILGGQQLQKAVSLTIETNERTLAELQSANNHVVQAMAEISESSTKISGIINLINDIAFQTNLLALNASVEAARAGDHGKGFAVVATEVRKLAHRSAKASSEIGELVELEMKSIKNGREFVEGSDKALKSMQKETEEMLQTLKNKSNLSMEEILESVIKFSEMMENIEVASSEHASGISQVNVAIADMDKLTQENYVMVEQNASASQKMAMEAEKLRRLFSSKEEGRQGNDTLGIGVDHLKNRPTQEIPATTHQGVQSEDEQKIPQIEMPKGGRNFENFK